MSHEAREGFGARLDRLEHDVRELSARLSRGDGPGAFALSRISFVGWLQVSGPTFAAMVLGFTLLWNAQQLTSAQMLEHGRALGQLEGALGALDARIGLLEGTLGALDARIGRLEGTLGALDARIERLGESVERLGERISRLGPS